MPKIVDHQDRRRELAQAALRVIGRDGLDAATTRAVAVESGWSTGVLKHYFAGKDQLLREALREAERVNLARFEAAAQQLTGLAAIRTAVLAILRAGRDESRLWIAFMHRATVDRPTGAAMRRAVEVWVERWQEIVERGQLDGSIRPDLDAHAAALQLHALVSGLRLDAMFLATGTAARAPEPAVELTLLEALAPTPPKVRRRS